MRKNGECTQEIRVCKREKYLVIKRNMIKKMAVNKLQKLMIHANQKQLDI